MELIKKTDPRYFTSTHDGGYDRHRYQVFLKTGQSKTFEYWEEAQKYWFEWAGTGQLDRIRSSFLDNTFRLFTCKTWSI